VRDRGTEQGEDCNADEFINEATKALHRRSSSNNSFWSTLQNRQVEPLAQRGEAARIRK